MKRSLWLVAAVVASTASAATPSSRDPFQPPRLEIVDGGGECLSDPREFCGLSLSDLKIVGTVYGAQPFVMIESPDTFGHVVKVGARLPQNRVVDAVTSHSIWLRAQFRAADGSIKSLRYEVPVGESLK